MAKRPWNIWNIKNRWVRAIIAWLLVLALLPLAIVGLSILCLLFTLVGAYRGIKDEFQDAFSPRGWVELAAIMWRAMTARESA